ncbi:hypothetical protein TNIN_72381 [Trichonephila inaurata madagascariensis]|uniref:Uncharacterized protein n=1 Tax=Trichonephila inaurata madagascariensis TaxID=2747483 RepID=A0A8X7BP00_9ARAC|nr:hypothetical protein TNIN_72381 [Trichonephila inaurata madagascariensis]
MFFFPHFHERSNREDKYRKGREREVKLGYLFHLCSNGVRRHSTPPRNNGMFSEESSWSRFVPRALQERKNSYGYYSSHECSFWTVRFDWCVRES